MAVYTIIHLVVFLVTVKACDILYLMDGTSSLDETAFNYQKQFFQQLTPFFLNTSTFSSNGATKKKTSRIGIIEWSSADETMVDYHFNDEQTISSINSKISNISFSNFGSNVNNMFNISIELFKHESSLNTSKIMLFATDFDSDASTTHCSYKNGMISNGIHAVVVYVTRESPVSALVCLNETLDEYDTGTTQWSSLLLDGTFEFVYNISKQVCSQPTLTPTIVPTFMPTNMPLFVVSSTLQSTNWTTVDSIETSVVESLVSTSQVQQNESSVRDSSTTAMVVASSSIVSTYNSTTEITSTNKKEGINETLTLLC